MKQYRYSIIIPHKNIPDLLQRCLDSIPDRDDIQTIVIDDNSDPSIVNFKHFPGLGRKNCEVIFTKEGKGAGYARNVGLKRVQSRWVLFADCDDFFSESFIPFLDKYKEYDADVIYFYNSTVDCDTLEPLDFDKKVQGLLPLCQKKGNMDPLRYLSYSPWCKMVSTYLIRENNICFQEVMASNDVWFSTMVGHYAKKIDVSDMYVYIRTIRQGSLQYSLKKENLLSRIKVGYEVNAFLRSVGKIEYYNETWGYFMDLRHISWTFFLFYAPFYFLHTPFIALRKNISVFFK